MELTQQSLDKKYSLGTDMAMIQLKKQKLLLSREA